MKKHENTIFWVIVIAVTIMATFTVWVACDGMSGKISGLGLLMTLSCLLIPLLFTGNGENPKGGDK